MKSKPQDPVFCHVRGTTWPKCPSDADGVKGAHTAFVSAMEFFVVVINVFKERERNMNSTYLCTHWLILVCALTRDQTHNLAVSEWCCSQLTYPARASTMEFYPQDQDKEKKA